MRKVGGERTKFVVEDYSPIHAQTDTPCATLPSGWSGHLDSARRHSSDIVERTVDGELVVYDLAAQVVHVLNPTAALVWFLCDGIHSRTDIVSALAEHFDEDHHRVREDVAMILQSFAAAGLLEESANDVIPSAE